MHVMLEGVVGDGSYGRGVVNERVFEKLWTCLTPSKVIAFSWKLHLDSIPTRRNLVVCHVIPPRGFVGLRFLCWEMEALSIHLLLHCDLGVILNVKETWYSYYHSSEYISRMLYRGG